MYLPFLQGLIFDGTSSAFESNFTFLNMLKQKNVKIIKGILPESLKDNCPKKIAFVHIDLNNTLAEIGVLKFIFDRIVSGGIIILDDFGWSAYSEQQQKEKDFFQKRNLKVMELPTGQGIVLKR